MTLIVNVKGKHYRDDEGRGDELGRSGPFGYDVDMTDEEVFEGSRAAWRFGPRAQRETVFLVVHEGIVVLAARIDGIVKVGTDGRSAVVGEPYPEGHPLRERFVGKPSPAPVSKGAQNPVRYAEDEPGTTRPCACGCGQPAPRDFLRGHDQRAIHDRLAQFGSVLAFVQWFDEVRPATAA